MRIEQNQRAYNLPEIVDYYIRYEKLQRPEEAIFRLLEKEMKHMKMLDIGVGSGRTTKFFASKVKEYKAIDYSSEMISQCKIQFRGTVAEENFLTADARDLSIFPDNYFDFILFSFNGIDNVRHEDRKVIFLQIKRLLAKEGVFCFSSHNLLTIKTWNKIQFTLNPLGFARNIITHFKRKHINKLTEKLINNLPQMDYLQVNDGAHKWKLSLTYVRPSYQVSELRDIGFQKITIFNLDHGEVVLPSQLELLSDKWLYYLCKLN